jgi:hypothetical protein
LFLGIWHGGISYSCARTRQAWAFTLGKGGWWAYSFASLVLLLFSEHHMPS